MIKNFRSIDGFFNEKLNLEEINNIKKNKYYLPIGSGSSISRLSFKKGVNLIIDKKNYEIIFDKRKKLVTVSANTTVGQLHNFLLSKKFYCDFFPSYSLATIGSCIASGTHGQIPQKGVFNDFVKEIKIFNPNFGIKTLTKNNNAELFKITKSGLGLTGIILQAKIYVKKIKSTKISYNTKVIHNLHDAYKFLKKSNYDFQQNVFSYDPNKKKPFLGRIYYGKFCEGNFIYKKLSERKIPKIRLGIFKINIFKKIIFKILFFLESFKNKFCNEMHINDILFTSNKRFVYFNFLPKKFIEYQNIVPDHKVKKYLADFEIIFAKHKPNITLMHLKIFNKKPQGFEFNGKGMSVAIHIVVDKNFKNFTRSLFWLDAKYGCKINIYKNSLVNKQILKKFYPKYYKKYCSDLKKINKFYKFSNSIF